MIYETPQQVFDIVAAHLLKQGRRAEVRPDGACRLRLDDGCKCAVGILIPDSVYDEAMEHDGSADGLLEAFPKVRRLFKFKPADLLYDLQRVHDEASPVDWATSLRSVASKHNLSPAILDGAS